VSWRNDLRGIRRVDLISAALSGPTLAWAGFVLAQDAPETQVPVQETQVQETGDAQRYTETWEWCAGRFPYRDDLQEACRWGAYEMLPGQEVPADEGMQNVMDRS
jgi:hypothetical protein